MSFTEINGIVELHGGSRSEWDLVDAFIPEGMLAYSNDKIFKLGDGTKPFRDLDIFFDASNLSKLQMFQDKFPKLNINLANKLLIVNEKGDGYAISDFTVGELITDNMLQAALLTKADKDHTHSTNDVSGLKSACLRDIGNNPGMVPEIGTDNKLDPSIIPIVAEDKLADEELLVWLVFGQLEADKSSMLNMTSGFSDVFSDENFIDKPNCNDALYTDNTKYIMKDQSVLISKVKDLGSDVTALDVYLRAEYTSTLDINLSVSRDGGTVFESLELNDTQMTNGTIKIAHAKALFKNLPQGKDLVWKIETTKPCTIHGISVMYT